MNKKTTLNDHSLSYRFLIRHILLLGAFTSSGNCPANNCYFRADCHLEKGRVKRRKRREGESKTTEFLNITLVSKFCLHEAKVLTGQSMSELASGGQKHQLLGSISFTRKSFITWGSMLTVRVARTWALVITSACN